MKIALIGSTCYFTDLIELSKKLIKDGNEVKLPLFDSDPELSIIERLYYNKEIIKWADEIWIKWDGKSCGAMFDFGMCFMLEKPLKVLSAIGSSNYVSALWNYSNISKKEYLTMENIV